MGSCELLEDSNVLFDHLGQDLNSSDKDWNMIALSPQLHDWWDRGLWAFKCLGVIEEPLSRIQLQFCWIVSKGSDPQCEVDVEDDEEVSRDIACCSPRRKEGKVAIRNIHKSRGVMSGDIMEIKMPHEKAVKMNAMVDLQWAMISLLTLSGAASSPELLRDPDVPEDVQVEGK